MLVALREEILFAYCLRSSVVSVLFSLISESSRSGNTLIIPIFGPRDLASVLAYVLLHSVIGLPYHFCRIAHYGSTFSSIVILRLLSKCKVEYMDFTWYYTM
ncbi:hypothetical protein ACN42_g11132 [Penicillium freii]|uniref:Uncharacterized protein n=1 Tax=Penicillium freii TaxID=48697 RepID=A0A101M8Y2_PENFR|nr:hypothetical protein ACN42_g11132 [Penicillium freii]